MTKRVAPGSQLMAAKKASTLELYIYGPIGSTFFEEGVKSIDVAKALDKAGDISQISLRINSPGGYVGEGAAIHSLLASRGVPIQVKIDGFAMSSAFTVAMVGDTISIGEAAMMMLHEGHVMTVGTSADLRKQADVLDKINATVASIYSNRSGQTLDAVTAMMAVETYLTPPEAIAKGFATEILKAETGSVSARASAKMWDMSRYARHVPDALKADADDDACPCPCDGCVAGNCDDCTTTDCGYDGCDCDGNAASALAKPDYSLYEQRLRLAALQTSFILTLALPGE